MCATLGGRAAEQLTFQRISTGALSDLERVTKQAYAMTSIYGLNERVGNISFYDSQGRDAFTKPYSEDTAKVIDEEVSKLIEGQYQRALQLLGENQEKLAQLAEKLLTSEVIFKEDLEEIFGKRPWDPIEEAQLIAEPTQQIEATSDLEPISEVASTQEETNSEESSSEEQSAEEQGAEEPTPNA
jgi:cell division protease FtsH